MPSKDLWQSILEIEEQKLLKAKYFTTIEEGEEEIEKQQDKVDRIRKRINEVRK